VRELELIAGPLELLDPVCRGTIGDSNSHGFVRQTVIQTSGASKERRRRRWRRRGGLGCAR
jgi:hypothetical protein